jgi:photosystem II stability/assembly factor-like uncharacterized protein
MMKKFYTLLIALFLSFIVSGQWVQQTPAWGAGNIRTIMFVDENNGWILYESFAISYTSNGGADWEGCFVLSIWLGTGTGGGSMFFTDLNNGWIMGADSLCRTTDGGLGCESNWESLNDTLISSLNEAQPSPFFLDTLNGWCILNRDYEPGPTQGYVYRTINGGESWAESQGLGVGRWLMDIIFVDNNNGWAIDKYTEDWNGALTGLMKSTDGGINWHSTNDSIGGTSLYFINETKGWFTGIIQQPSYWEAKGIWYTNDGGNTLIQQVGDTVPQLNDITFSDELNGWAVGDEGTILHTSNGGQNWEYQESGTLADLHSVCFINQNMGWICGDSGVILHTNNGGIVGIEKPKKEAIDFKVYPNPTNSAITIELPTQPSINTSLTISNTNGQQLITQPIAEPQTEIDIGYLPTGIYIVKVWNNREVMVRKVIKQ